MKTSKQVLIILCFALFGCGGGGSAGTMEGRRSGQGTDPQTGLSGKVKQEALKNKALIEVQPGTVRLNSQTEGQISFGLSFRLNNQMVGYRSFVLDIKPGEEKAWEGRQYDLTAATRLSFRALRLKETNQEILALHFLFENRESETIANSSYLLMLSISDGKIRVVKETLLYPQDNKIELKDWIKQKQVESNAAALPRDNELELEL